MEIHKVVPADEVLDQFHHPSGVATKGKTHLNAFGAYSDTLNADAELDSYH
jgi:hypothetical protein